MIVLGMMLVRSLAGLAQEQVQVVAPTICHLEWNWVSECPLQFLAPIRIQFFPMSKVRFGELVELLNQSDKAHLHHRAFGIVFGARRAHERQFLNRCSE